MQVKNFIVDGNVIGIGASGTGVSQESITWADLVNLRNNGKLVPGCKYRIIDYETVIDEPETCTAGHLFDIIVTALSENTLSEYALATHHEGDTYFQDSKLEAWQLKYCLDNDSDRFGWANVINGKGVIYRMTDEFGNSCPYDFKNIKFSDNLGHLYTASIDYWYTFTAGYLTQYQEDVDLSMRDVNYVTNNYISDNRYQIYHPNSNEVFGNSGFIPATGTGSYIQNGSVFNAEYPWTPTEILQLPFIQITGVNHQDDYVCPNCCALRIAHDLKNGEIAPVKILMPLKGCNIQNSGIYTTSVSGIGSDATPATF